MTNNIFWSQSELLSYFLIEKYGLLPTTFQLLTLKYVGNAVLCLSVHKNKGEKIKNKQQNTIWSSKLVLIFEDVYSFLTNIKKNIPNSLS